MKFLILTFVQLPPALKEFFLERGGGWEEGRGQGTAEHRPETVFQCSSEHAVSLITSRGKKDEIPRLVSQLGLLPVLINGKRSIFQMAVRVKQILTFKPFECSYCCLSTATIVCDQMKERSAMGLTAATLMDYHFEDRESDICQQRSFNALLKQFLSQLEKTSPWFHSLAPCEVFLQKTMLLILKYMENHFDLLFAYFRKKKRHATNPWVFHFLTAFSGRHLIPFPTSAPTIYSNSR